MQRRRSVWFAFGVVVLSLGLVSARSELQAQTAPQIDAKPQAPPPLTADAAIGFRIEFMGREPSSDWARVANLLVDRKLVPLETLQLKKGLDPCSAVLDQLNFRDVGLRCSDEMRAFIRKLNPSLPPSVPVGASVIYPKLPVSEMSWFAGFDRAQPGETDRYNLVREAWKALKVNEKSKGSQVQVEFRGFQTQIAPSDSADTKKALAEIERFDTRLQRFDTRVLELSKAPLMKPFSMADPVGWAELCRNQPLSPPAPPAPPYISLINGSKDDLKCVAKCKDADNCPEIVLLDQAVAPHPDVARALDATPAGGTPSWCPFVDFNPAKHHGTHMAGIMVGSGLTSGFPGLAPNARLEGRDIGEIVEQSIPDVVREKNFFYPRTNVVFVFASQFPGTKELSRSELRFATPRYVEDILASQRLWIVAAGQKSDQQSDQMEIGRKTNASPMNLGDHGAVLVVTACEDCYGKQPTIASWANYSGTSSGGLVNLAAPGGTAEKKIPSPVTGKEHGLAYGTSQATALVGGLAAAMMSCYPTSYSAHMLKMRILATAQTSVSGDVAEKVSVGIVDAKRALLDPDVHWATLKSTGAQEKFKGIEWCTQDVFVKDPDDDTPRLVDVRKIHALGRKKSGEDGWFVIYQQAQSKLPKSAGETIRVATLSTAPEKLRPLLRFRKESGTWQPPLPLDEIDDLLVGVKLKATSKIRPGFAGCKP